MTVVAGRVQVCRSRRREATTLLERCSPLAFARCVGVLEPSEAFVTFLRDHRAAILVEWERRVRGLPPATNLDPPALIDHLPLILDDIAEAADAALAGEEPPPLRSHPDSHRHATLRGSGACDSSAAVAALRPHAKETMLYVSRLHVPLLSWVGTRASGHVPFATLPSSLLRGTPR